MPGNPFVDQGSLNRLRGSVTIPNYPNLNVTAPFLAPAAIGISFEGQTTLMLPTLTGTVTSPEPYQMVMVTVALLKTQALAAQYEAQRQSDARLGDLTIRLDASTLPDYPVRNSAIENVRELTSGGTDAAFVVTLSGYLPVNNNLWNLI